MKSEPRFRYLKCQSPITSQETWWTNEETNFAVCFLRPFVSQGRLGFDYFSTEKSHQWDNVCSQW